MSAGWAEEKQAAGAIGCRGLLLAAVATMTLGLAGMAQAAKLDVEKDELKFGFIKLTDMAPLAVAKEKGFRSEEHTSELQSLMRISYAVFCLKKKKNQERKQ